MVGHLLTKGSTDPGLDPKEPFQDLSLVGFINDKGQQEPPGSIDFQQPEELKEDDQAIKNLRQLLARYAEAFPDARAAYAMILWDQGRGCR